MQNKNDILRPTQPYFVLETEDFFQEVYLKQGISHFYTFRLEKAKELTAVPDGCIDLVFIYYNNQRMRGYACGSVLQQKKQIWPGPAEIFGIRFMPGYHPAGLHVPLRLLVEQQLPLEKVYPTADMFPLLAKQDDFYQRIRFFLQEYTKIEKEQSKPFGKKELVLSVKTMVYLSDGKIRIAQLAEQTGYTERYINKVFIEEMGFSPKVFCKIIQFQRSLELLNYGIPESMTNAAVSLGYYDQPQFIRDFKKYAGVTPKKYLDIVQSKKYQDKISDTAYL